MKYLSVASLLLAVTLSAQPRATFEVAAIRPYHAGGPRAMEVTPGTVNWRGARLGVFIAWAYSVEEFEVSGPAWISDLRFDISANAATPATIPDMKRMMQTLLADRFKLAIHREQREMSAIVLTLGKGGHKLVENNAPDSPGFSFGELDLTGNGATLQEMTDFITRQMRIRIIDQTGLTGRYNYRLNLSEFMTEDVRRRPGFSIELPGIVAAAIQEQLGLRVESGKFLGEIIVVDSVEKAPTEN